MKIVSFPRDNSSLSFENPFRAFVRAFGNLFDETREKHTPQSSACVCAEQKRHARVKSKRRVLPSVAVQQVSETFSYVSPFITNVKGLKYIVNASQYVVAISAGRAAHGRRRASR